MGRRSLETHDHSSTGNGGGDINPKTIGEETPAESISTEDATITQNFSYQFDGGINVSSSRSIGTTYQNTTGSLMKVFVRIDLDASGSVDFDGFAGPESDPVNAKHFAFADRSTYDSGDRVGYEFLVPDGQYYHVRERDNNSSLGQWIEKEADSP